MTEGSENTPITAIPTRAPDVAEVQDETQGSSAGPAARRTLNGSQGVCDVVVGYIVYYFHNTRFRKWYFSDPPV